MLFALLCILLCTQALAEDIEIKHDPGTCTWLSVKCVETQFGLSDEDGADYGDFSPPEGGVFFFGKESDGYDEDSVGKNTFVFLLYFDQKAVDSLQKSWAGLELDIVFEGISNTGFLRINQRSIKCPEGLRCLRDTTVELTLKTDSATRGINILNPQDIKAGWNEFVFSLNEDEDGVYRDIGSEDISFYADIQLSANVADPNFLKTIYKYNSFTWASAQLAKWLGVEASGNTLVSPLAWAGSSLSELRIDPNGAFLNPVFSFFTMVSATQGTDGEDTDGNPVGHPTLINQYSNGTGFYWTNRKGTKADVATSTDLEKFLEIKKWEAVAYRDKIHKAVRSFTYKLVKKISNVLFTRYFNNLNQQILDSLDGKNDSNEEAEPIIVNAGRNKESKKVDVDVAKVRASNGAKTAKHKTLIVEAEEHIYAWVFVKNKLGNAYGVNASFYLDGGDKLHLNRREKDFIGEKSIGMLYSGEEIWYAIGFYAPEEPGKYTLYACINTTSNDSKPSNNCSGKGKKEELAKLTVVPKYQDPNEVDDPVIDDPIIDDPIIDDPVDPPTDPVDPPVEPEPVKPTIIITAPTEGETWRGDPDVKLHVEWTSTTDFNLEDRVKIEFSMDGGNTWDYIDDDAVWDGGKFWNACLSETIDTDDARIRVTLLEDPTIYGEVRFTFDHAKGCN